MIKRKYIFSCQVCHGNGSGDKEYWNGVITFESWFRPSAEDLICDCRALAVEKLQHGIDRRIDTQDVQVLCLNKF